MINEKQGQPLITPESSSSPLLGEQTKSLEEKGSAPAAAHGGQMERDLYCGLDLLGRLENELANKEEAWRTQQLDPHNIATAVYVTLAEIRASLNTAIAESVSRSNVRSQLSQEAE